MLASAGDDFIDDPVQCFGGDLVDRVEAFLVKPGSMASETGFYAHQYCTHCFTYHLCGANSDDPEITERRRYTHRLKAANIADFCVIATTSSSSRREHRILLPEVVGRSYDMLDICPK